MRSHFIALAMVIEWASVSVSKFSWNVRFWGLRWAGCLCVIDVVTQVGNRGLARQILQQFLPGQPSNEPGASAFVHLVHAPLTVRATWWWLQVSKRLSVWMWTMWKIPLWTPASPPTHTTHSLVQARWGSSWSVHSSTQIDYNLNCCNNRQNCDGGCFQLSPGLFPGWTCSNEPCVNSSIKQETEEWNNSR